MKLRALHIAAHKPRIALCVAGFLFSQSALAAIPAPRLKPTLQPSSAHVKIIEPVTQKVSKHLSVSDARYFQNALDQADKKNWLEVRRMVATIKDRTASDTLRWIIAVDDRKASFNEVSYVVHNMSDWPRMTGLRARGEGMIFDQRLPSQQTIDWFKGEKPVSGEGRAALARAYFAKGDIKQGNSWLKSAWRYSKLTRDRQKTLFQEFKGRLTPDDHAARADHLIWSGRAHFGKVQGLLSLMTPPQRALMDARMRVASNRSGMDAAVSRVPRSLLSDPGLLYERARWRRRKQSKSYALPMYTAISSAPTSDVGKTRMWREKKIMTYWAIEEKKYDLAYKLTQHHGFERGTSFAEAEFLAGWLSLEKLNEPERAKVHFKNLRAGVTFPVSLSRANYWLGRANDALNNYEAQLNYVEAAKFNNTFYGFLARKELGGANMIVSLPYESNAAHLKSTFESDRRVKAMHILGEAEHEKYFTRLAFHMDDVLETQEHLTLLAKMAKNYGFMRPSLRAAKQASRFKSMLTESGYPMPDAIMSLPQNFDKAFVLAIARQESEFNHRAVSHARAYGLMQMINATARSTARKHRVPYSRSRMTKDMGYSAKLGALHLHDLLDDYDGSYIMSAVAYNAGPHRVRQWVRTYGDPRTGEIDPINWLESIPFSETRNYVQRVIENMQVYRARMNGNTATNRVHRDITTGAF